MLKWFVTDEVAQNKMQQAEKAKSLEESNISELKKPWKFGQ